MGSQDERESANDPPRLVIARIAEGAGGLIWLAALTTFVLAPTHDIASPVIRTLGFGAVLGAAGLAGQLWDTAGRATRVSIAAALLGGVGIATGEWPLIIFGLLAVVAGTAAVGLGQLRRPSPGQAVGIALLVGATGAASILAGPNWFVAAFGLAHLVAAAMGSAPLGLRTGWRRSRALGGAALAALVVVVASGALASGQLRLPGGVTASVRTGALPTLPVVVDTDMHPDDWLALLYLLSEPNVDVRAVAVDGGSVVGCEAGVGIARDLLAAVGRGQIPVACGPAPSPGGIPLSGDWAREFKGIAMSLGWTPSDGDPAGAPTSVGDAVALLRAAVSPGPVTIVSLGPPTNVARLLDDTTWDRSVVVRIVQMAGAVDVPGNVEGLPSVEFNAAVDPAALASVLSDKIEVVMVGLDATNRVPIRIADIDRFTADRSTRAADLAARIFDSRRDFARAGGYFAWDVLAAIAARQPDIIRTETIALRVATDAGQAGRTVRDSTGGPILVAVDADPSGFERILLDALLGRAK